MLQYPKLEHTTLPSVSDWYKNTNILKDPPRAIVTRRIDKVGQTTDINEMVDASCDRASEAIRVYAKGVNPMVSVSYDNNSNNAGVYGMGGFTSMSSKTQASVPYKAMNNGAFRPPIRTQRDLLPLSRLPRVWFQAMSTPGFTDYSKSKYVPTIFRAVKDLLSAYDIEPNKCSKVEKPILENFKMIDSINDKHINIEATSGTASKDIKSYTRENIDMYKGINNNIIEAWANTNLTDNRSHNLEGLSIDSGKYTRDSLNYEANTNINQNRSQNLEGLSIDSGKYTHDSLNYEANTNLNDTRTQNFDNISMSTEKYIQNIPQFEKTSGINTGYTFFGEMATPETERNLPSYNLKSSISDSRVYKKIEHENELKFKRNLPITDGKTNIKKIENFDSMNISSRDFNRLIPKVKKESFENNGIIPKVLTIVPEHSGVTNKDKIRTFVSEQQFDRYNK